VERKSADGGAKNRALRGSAVRSGLSTPRCFVPRLNPFNPLRTNRERLRWAGSGVPRPVNLDLCKAGFRGSPCCLDTTTRSMFRVLPWAPPLACFFVKPDSGAQRATWTQQHAQRAGSGVNPLRTNRQRLRRKDRRGSAPPPAQFPMMPGSGARHRADPCKTGFRGTP
jgi:hypothetical protein